MEESDEIEDSSAADFPVFPYTVQLFHSPESKLHPDHISLRAPQQIASGVLIESDRGFFLITCKHVFDSIDVYDVIILTTWGFSVRPLPENVRFIDNENRSIDLAFIRFTDDQVSALLARNEFLPVKDLGFGHAFDSELFYMMFGFINKQTKREDIEFYSTAFGYLTSFRRYRKIGKLGFSYDNNVTLEYTVKKQAPLEYEGDQRSMGRRDLKGLSGGGIWLSVPGNQPDTFNYLLVGIMIEERIDRGFIVGTKIDAVETFLK
jgi:hypothetical protein